MSRGITIVLGLIAVLALDSRVTRADAVRDAVENGNRAFIAAFLRGDAKAVSELYTEDAQVIAPGAPVARGRAAIAAAWQEQGTQILAAQPTARRLEIEID